MLLVAWFCKLLQLYSFLANWPLGCLMVFLIIFHGLETVLFVKLNSLCLTSNNLMALCGSLQNKIKLLTYLGNQLLFVPTNVLFLFLVAYFHNDRFALNIFPFLKYIFACTNIFACLHGKLPSLHNRKSSLLTLIPAWGLITVKF